MFYVYFMCMYVFPTCMYVHHVSPWCQSLSEEDFGCPGTRVLDGCEPLSGGWELGLLQEQQMPLTAEPSLLCKMFLR